MFGTPDFDRSDFWHFHFAIKTFLSESLKNGHFPFWSKDMGTGFPLFAEGQIGMFNLYNLISFTFLSSSTAYTLGYLVIIIVTFSGTYFFSRSLHFTKLGSLFAAVAFSLSANFFTRVPHFNFLQVASLMPWIFFCIEKIIATKKLRFGLLLSFVISQQIYSGYPQMVFISSLGALIFFCFRLFQNYSRRSLLICLTFSFLGIILGLPQLLASWQLINLSPPLLPETFRIFPYNPLMLLSFINPYILGNPANGTFPPPSSDWGIFWECSGYVGFITLLFALLSLRVKKNPLKLVFITIATIALLLLLGKNSFLSSIQTLPPLNFFRLPSRFLILFSFALVMLATTYLDRIKNTFLVKLIVLITTVELLFFSLGYNAIIDPATWLKPPKVINTLSQDKSWFRSYSAPISPFWNEIFWSNGWQNMNLYLPFKESLTGNENLYWHVSSANFYSRLAPRRLILYKLLIDQGFKFDERSMTYSLSDQSIKLLRLAGVKYLTSPVKIVVTNTNSIKLVDTYPDFITFYLYKIEKPFPHAYLTTDFKFVAPGNLERRKIISNPDSQTIAIEKNIHLSPKVAPIKKVDVIKNSDMNVKIIAKADATSILVLSDSFYPSWQATIDGEEVEIFPVNINQRGVMVPKGKHLIEFSYQPLRDMINLQVSDHDSPFR